MSTRIEKLFEKNLEILLPEQILTLSNKISDIALVLDGNELSTFSYITNGDIKNGYYLYYVTKKYGQLEGCILKLKPNLKSRSDLTFLFSDYIYSNFSENHVIYLHLWFEKIQYILFEKNNIIDDYKDSFSENLWITSQEEKAKGRETFIYIMHDIQSGLFKIGQSKNVRFREKTLLPLVPKISTVTYKKTSVCAEKALHKKYKSKRIRGEWFKLTMGDVKDIEKFLIYYEGGK